MTEITANLVSQGNSSALRPKSAADEALISSHAPQMTTLKEPRSLHIEGRRAAAGECPQQQPTVQPFSLEHFPGREGQTEPAPGLTEELSVQMLLLTQILKERSTESQLAKCDNLSLLGGTNHSFK